MATVTERTAGGAGEIRRELAIDGARTVVFERGAGEPCLLLHGYPQDHRCWRRVAGPLARTHRVIAPDWPGWGESIGGAEIGARYDDEAARIGKILDALGIERANLVVHDYGAHLALGFAARNTQRVLRLAVLNSRAHGVFPPWWYAQFATMGWMARTPAFARLLAALPIYELHRRNLLRYVRNGSFSAEELESYIGWMRTAEGKRRFVRFYRDYQTRFRRELPDACRSIDVPAAVIYGDRDPYNPFAIGEDLARRLPRARLVRIAGADHYVAEERAAEVLAALAALLADETGTRAARFG